MKLLVAAILPQPQLGMMEELQRQYGPSHWEVKVPPHVTIARPWEATTSIATAHEVFAQADLMVEHFTLRCSGVEFFAYEGAYVVFSCILNPEPLRHLQSELQPQLAALGYDDKRPYNPHITIANKLQESEFTSVWPHLKESNLDYEACIEAISLLKKEPSDNTWQQIATLALHS